MFLYHLAHELKKTVSEVKCISATELKGWVAYFEALNKGEQ